VSQRRTKYKNMAKQNPMLMIAVIGVLVLLVLGGGYYFATNQQTQFKTLTGDTPQACADSIGILTVAAVSELNQGTNLSPTITAGVNGGVVTSTVTSGTTTFPIGSNVEVLVSQADYIDKSFTFKMPCGGKTLPAGLYYSTSDNPGLRVKNDDGDYVTNAIGGGATNQTDVAAGETVTLEVELTGTSLESSGDGVLVIEFPTASAANITKVELSGASVLSGIPSVHSTVNAGSKVVAFDISAVIGSAKDTHTLTITLGSTKDLAGGVYMDWYAKQAFVDTNGKIITGIQNADGTAKYENTLDFDFAFAGA